ncbi:MAG: RNHCP domain-containing protein [Candidatus Uhrbacteria bacterium]
MKRKNFYGQGNDAFSCERCRHSVEPLSNGSFRNHCPFCLWCKHVDIVPGDREETCRGLMEPVRIEKHTKKGWMVVHKCLKCGKEQRNKTAPDDNLDLLLSLM